MTPEISKKFTVRTLTPPINWVPMGGGPGFCHTEVEVRDAKDKLVAAFHFGTDDTHWQHNYDLMGRYVELFLGALRSTGADVVTEVGSGQG